MKDPGAFNAGPVVEHWHTNRSQILAELAGRLLYRVVPFCDETIRNCVDREYRDDALDDDEHPAAHEIIHVVVAQDFPSSVTCEQQCDQVADRTSAGRLESGYHRHYEGPRVTLEAKRSLHGLLFREERKFLTTIYTLISNLVNIF
jgi:hypothetical protein